MQACHKLQVVPVPHQIVASDVEFPFRILGMGHKHETHKHLLKRDARSYSILQFSKPKKLHLPRKNVAYLAR